MKRTENLRTLPLKAAKIEWEAREIVGIDRHDIGTYTHPMGICSVYHRPRSVTIKTVVGGVLHQVTVQGNLTCQMVAMRCNKLLKSLQ